MLLLATRGAQGGLSAAGLVVGAYGAATVCAGPVVGRLSDRWGPRRVLVAGAGIHAAALVAFAF